jgi:predicted amidohydrolase YtcJ
MWTNDERRLKLVAMLLVALMLSSCSEPARDRLAGEPDRGLADLILFNGQIITVDQDFSVAQALAIAGEKLIAVGNDQQVTELADANTRVIDLRGATVLPGINNAHIHLAWWAATLSQLDLRDKNIDQIQAALAERVAQSQSGQAILGMGWSEGSLGRRPTKADLDAIAPDNPVAFEEMGHALWVNSKMLELAGISEDTPEPTGVKFERDPATGDLTGVLHEADELVLPHIPKPSDDIRKQTIIDGIEVLNRMGVTSVTDPSVELDQAAIYEALADAGQLSARVSVHLKGGRSLQEAQTVVAGYAEKSKGRGTSHNFLTLRGVKLYMDGAPPGRTALMFEDYACCPGERGLLLFNGETEAAQIEEVYKAIEWVHRQGYQMGIHASGDRSASIAIDGLIRAMREYPVDPEAPNSNGLRHYLIHGDLVRDEDIARMAEWDIGLVIQPVITYAAGHLLLELWGPERGARHMATGLFVEAGVRTSITTDSPIVPPDWKQNIEYAVLRKNQYAPDKINGPEYRISVQDAIVAVTRTPAYQDFQDDIKGTIEPGKLADLVVIDADPLAIDPEDISDIKTLMTILGGAIVYEDSQLTSGR